MNNTIMRIQLLEEVPEEKALLFGEAGDLVKFAEENGLLEAVAMAFKYGFSAGRSYEKEN